MTRRSGEERGDGRNTVGALAVLQVDNGCIGIQISLVVLGVESQKHVADHDRSVELAHRCDESLAQIVAHLDEAENVPLNLLRGDFLVHRKSDAARGSHRHGREAVVMTGRAGGLGHEIGVGLLDERKTSPDGASDGVVVARLQLGRRRCIALCAGLQQEGDDGRVAVLAGDVADEEES